LQHFAIRSARAAQLPRRREDRREPG
jgi:hypothetical protein